MLFAFACGSSSSDGSKGSAGAGGDGRGGNGASSGAAGKGNSGGGAVGRAGSDAAGAPAAGEGGDSGALGSDSGAAGSDSAGAAGSGDVPVPPSTVTLTVHVAQARHAISPLVYGINPHAGIVCGDASAKYGLCRLGGHAWSTYNWENNASNAGIDNCNQNDGTLGLTDTPALAVTSTVAAAEAAGSATLVTIPILDYVAADKAPGTASPDCSGDVRKSANYLTTRFKSNRATKGAALSTTPDTTDAYVNQDEFVSFLGSQAASAKVLFALDNQPGTWSIDQPAAHPDKATYAEVVQRNVQYATMLRNVWPTAEVTGYVGYGYYGFRTLQDATDAAGNGIFLDYYLKQMKAASTSAGKRLIDYLDLHWYSEATGDGQRVLGDVSTAGMAAARVQAPRSLWDSTFLEKSWITDYTGAPIALIPWLNTLIANDYPGTKLAISEWSFGGGNDVSGALAAADTLGIFGVQSVGLAAYASSSVSDQFVSAAFNAFRNYDGAGAGFGDTSVGATTNSVAYAPVYASVDSADPDRVVVIAINRSDSAIPTTLNVDHTASYVSAQVYQLTSASASLVAGAPVTASSANSFNLSLPAFSISVIVPKKA
ncbi:MAG TPA: glycoside hydrolase family 44 protein [Polyangiaceae bacterium]